MILIIERVRWTNLKLYMYIVWTYNHVYLSNCNVNVKKLIYLFLVCMHILDRSESQLSQSLFVFCFFLYDCNGLETCSFYTILMFIIEIFKTICSIWSNCIKYLKFHVWIILWVGIVILYCYRWYYFIIVTKLILSKNKLINQFYAIKIQYSFASL